MVFEYLQGWKLHNLSGQSMPVLDHPHNKRVFPYIQMNPLRFQFVPVASGPATGHHWREPGCVSFALPLQIFVCVDKIHLSLLFSRLNSPSSLSLSS